MAIDRRRKCVFYFICEQHLAEICRHGVDAYGERFKTDRTPKCDMSRCPLLADFEYFPGLAALAKNIKQEDLVPLEDVIARNKRR